MLEHRVCCHPGLLAVAAADAPCGHATRFCHCQQALPTKACFTDARLVNRQLRGRSDHVAPELPLAAAPAEGLSQRGAACKLYAPPCDTTTLAAFAYYATRWRTRTRAFTTLTDPMASVPSKLLAHHLS